MRYSLVAAGLSGLAAAYPSVGNPAILKALPKRQLTSTAEAIALSQARSNCGPTPCIGFNAEEQFISTTGEYAYASPAATDIRGPCPGLNAAANHGYLDRSGVITIENTITGLETLYGMSPDLGAFLAAYAVIFDGDPLTGTWSIGGPPPTDPLTSGLLGGGQGISYSHNKYEGDTSIARGDAYVNDGDAHSLEVPRFASAFAVGMANDNYTLDLFAQNFGSKVDLSIDTNPYYFAAPFSTTLVAPAAYNFVINFMSNHSEEYPSGYLNGDIFKTFFAVTGDYPDFTWLPGQERIPDNWYRRTFANEYDIPDVLIDLGIQFLAYPDSFRLGGNINGTNTYEGVDLGDLTGGVFNNSADLFDLSGSNAACFYAQFVEAIIPDAANLLVGELSAITDLLNSYISPITGDLDCPYIDQFDQTLFNKFPGYTYQEPVGTAQNYKQ